MHRGTEEPYGPARRYQDARPVGGFYSICNKRRKHSDAPAEQWPRGSRFELFRQRNRPHPVRTYSLGKPSVMAHNGRHHLKAQMMAAAQALTTMHATTT